MFKRILLILVAPLVLLGIAAAPAFAGTPTSAQHTVNVSVNSVITISGLSDVSFTGNPGTTAPGIGTTSTNCSAPVVTVCSEAYSVTSNDGAGYSLTETAFSNNFTSSTNQFTIPTSDWSITPEINGVGGTIHTFSPTTTAFQIYSTTTGPSTDTVGEEWSLALPANLPAGAFSDQLTYMATGN